MVTLSSDPTPYTATLSHDALGRRRRLVHPADVEGRRRVETAEYGRGGSVTTVLLDDVPVLRRAAYNARGQQTFALFGGRQLVQRHHACGP
jgi:hypothetical protein